VLCGGLRLRREEGREGGREGGGLACSPKQQETEKESNYKKQQISTNLPLSPLPPSLLPLTGRGRLQQWLRDKRTGTQGLLRRAPGDMVLLPPASTR